MILKELAKLCIEKSLKIATAESCTGGGVAFEITSIPGSSNWFDRGFVTYSDLSKIEMLGVSKNSIDTYGAVSEEVAIQMAQGAIANSKGNISLAITGIAGPDGATATKPVGTCWFAWASPYFSTIAEQQLFPGDRANVRSLAISFSLNKLLLLIRNTSNTNS